MLFLFKYFAFSYKLFSISKMSGREVKRKGVANEEVSFLIRSKSLNNQNHFHFYPSPFILSYFLIIAFAVTTVLHPLFSFTVFIHAA